jgi:protein-S-isoprenylcysteine O-methyltransferase Ste14
MVIGTIVIVLWFVGAFALTILALVSLAPMAQGSPGVYDLLPEWAASPGVLLLVLAAGIGLVFLGRQLNRRFSDSDLSTR